MLHVLNSSPLLRNRWADRLLKEGNGRVTPSVYTTLDEVDRFTEAMLTAIKKGIA